MRAKIVPATAIDMIAKSGAGFAGFATWLDLTPAHPDMLVMPEADTLIQLPWKPEVAWVTGDLVMDGKPLKQNPRQVLKRVVEAAAKDGYEMKTGVECEYFLIAPDGSAISDGADTQAKPCYDQQALMRRYEVIKEICDAMIALGWNPYQNDHEDANGQFEMNWEYDTCLRTADKHAFFKFMVKSIAEKHGLRATFMPKPFLNLTGNGCHAHVSLWNKAGKNVFEDAQGEMGLSKEAYHFIGGLVHSADALAAITNPTVNSYKRINAPRTMSGATWSPNTVTYGGNNRTHMIRIPDAGRFELRLADGATNPYLLQAALLAVGPRWAEKQARSRQAARYRHVRRGPHGERRQEAAAQPARCAARPRQVEHPEEQLRRGCRRLLHQAAAGRVERIRRPADGLGTADDARLLLSSRALCPGSSVPQALEQARDGSR